MKKQLLMKTFLVAVGLCAGVSAAWAETISSLGKDDEGMASHQHTYTLKANKTLTLNFTVASTKGGNETNGYYVNIQQGVDKMGFQPGGGFYYTGDAWWNEEHIVKNDRSWGDLSEFTAFIPEASVELTIKRIHTQVLYYADITTKASARHYRRIISKEGTFDENADITVILGADFAVLTNITDVITDESITGTLIGKEDNSVGFGTNKQEFTLGADKSLTLNFINYSSKIGWADNWYVRVEKGSKWFELRSDFWGSESDGAGYYNRSENTSDAGHFVLSSSTGAYFDGFPTALHKANVVMTVTRIGKKLSISAVQTTLTDEVKTQTYNITHDDFETGDITFILGADYSHLDLLPVSKTITSAGWATYCSPYALNLAGASATLEDAYIVTGGNDGVLTLTSVKDKTVPANTGLLLKGSEGTEVTVTIPLVGSSTTNVAANKLVGVTAATPLAANGGYVLMGSPSVGFYQNSNAFTVGANTAYLPADFAAAARSFYSFGDATGIKAIDNSQLTIDNSQSTIDNYYNLKGQRVAQPTKGLYIKNGKKVIIK